MLALGFAAIGVVSICRKDYRRAMILLSFPAGHLLYMCEQKVHFALLTAEGLLAASSWVKNILERKLWSGERRVAAASLAAGIIGFTFTAGLPWSSIVSAYSVRPDSRNLVTHWVQNHVPRGAAIVLAKELAMNAGSLRSGYNVVEVPLWGLDRDTVPNNADAFWLIPIFGRDRRTPVDSSFRTSILTYGQERFEVLERFGANFVLLHYYEPAAAGDPMLVIARLSPPV
jgi:hypothetical protein